MSSENADQKTPLHTLERHNNALKRIPHALSHMDDLDSFLHSLCNTVADALGATWTTILTLDMEGRRITGNVLADATRAITPIEDFDEAMNGLTGWVVRKRRATRSAGSEPDSRESDFVQEKRRENGVGAVMVAPLVHGNSLLGTVTAGRRVGEEEFSEADFDLLKAVAVQAAIAVHTQDLYAEQRREIAERELLLREIHHRVKNNLSVIISLARLHQDNQHTISADEALEDLVRRIHAMSLVHDKLYESNDLVNVDVGTYLTQLVDNLIAFLDGSDRIVDANISVERTVLDIDTLIPLGLITNELVTNAIQHAFPDEYWTDPGFKPEVMVSFHLVSDTCILDVSDNGTGFSRDRSGEQRSTAGGGLGLTLTESLALQIQGQLEHLSHEGTRWRLSFPAPPARSVPALES